MSKVIYFATRYYAGVMAGTSTNYFFPIGDNTGDQSGGNTAEANLQTKYEVGGVFSKLYVKILANTFTGAGTYCTRKGGVSGNLTVSITANTTGEFEDTTHTDTVAVADLWCTMLTTGSGSSKSITVGGRSIVFSATTNTTKKYANSDQKQLSGHGSGQTWYNGFNENEQSIGTEYGYTMRTAGTFSNLYAIVYAWSGSSTITLRLRKNSTDTTIVVSMMGSGTYEDVSHTATVVSGDVVNYSDYNNGGLQSYDVGNFAIEFTSTNGNFFTANWSSSGTVLGQYLSLGGAGNPEGATSDSIPNAKVRGKYNFSYLGVSVQSNNYGSAGTVTLRKNSANTSLTVSITATTTGLFEDSTHSVVNADGDEMCYNTVAGSTIIATYIGVMMSENNSTTYTLALAQGSYTLTGNATLFHRYIHILIAQGSYTLTGNATLFHRYIHILIAQGSYTLTGIATLFHKFWKMSVITGTYAVTGIDVLFKRMKVIVATTGTYAVTGFDTFFLRPIRYMIASMGSYALTGEPITPERIIKMVASMGSYVVTGFDTLFHRFIHILITTGTYTLTGITTAFIRIRVLMATTGTYAVTGFSTAFEKFWKMSVTTGTYALTGITTTLHKVYKALTATQGSYTLTGENALFHKYWKMTANTGLYVLKGIKQRIIAPIHSYWRLKVVSLTAWAKKDTGQ